MRAKNDLVTFKCVDCSKTYEKTFDEDLSKKSENTYQLCDGNFNNFFYVAKCCLSISVHG